MKRGTVLFCMVLTSLTLGSGGCSRRASAGGQRQDPAARPKISGPYFSERDHIARRILYAIQQARTSIDIAVYDISERQIARALVSASRRGVRVRIVADAQQSEEPYSMIPMLRAAGVPVRRSGGYRGRHSLMHDKFAVFDDQVSETGSFNWTTSADEFNFENAIFLNDPRVASRFESEFNRIWAQAH